MKNPLKVYVAGASSERKQRAEPVIQKLREAGIEITFDWTWEMNNSPKDADLEPHDIQRCADSDMNGVREAHYVLFLAPKGSSTGAWVELGMAIAWRIPVISCGQATKRCIFAIAHSTYGFATDEEGVDYLVEVHRRRENQT